MRDELGDVQSGASSVRAAFRRWLDVNWATTLTLGEWRQRLVDSGWAQPGWPANVFGRAGSVGDAEIVVDELAAAGAVGLPPGFGTAVAGPVVLQHGTADLHRALLRPLLTGTDRWCELFTEPASGSDLASVTTSAVEAEDGWTVTGEKIWAAAAEFAAYGLLLARTGESTERHAGLTCFVLPMRQPGVTVRTLRQMNGRASNAVSIERAHVPAGFVLGGVGAGWEVARATLALERRITAHGPRLPSRASRAATEAATEMADHERTYGWIAQSRGRPDELPDHARRAGRDGDRVVRQHLARVYTAKRVLELIAERVQGGGAAGVHPSMVKLANSQLARAAAALHASLAGPAAVAWESDDATDIADVVSAQPASSLMGGTDEIQRNVLAERVLGLPRDARHDTRRP